MGNRIGREANLERKFGVEDNLESKFGVEDNLERKLQLPLQYLENITDNFSSDREIGRGGFGVVYEGIDDQSGVVIAVKKLKQILGPQAEQFKNEVNHLARSNHDNIVRLIGYCDETKERPVYDEYQRKFIFAEVQEKLLCYEYLSNGSLDNIIFDESCRLDWMSRYKIITGICQGLLYLHEGLDETPIVHMDLKPSNILLDANMVPKIADFGLSRLFSEEQTRTYTMNLMGSIGYMAPEYYRRGEISTKSDIYSLGILILEVVTGRKNYSARGNMTGEQFIENIRENWTTMPALMSKYPSLEDDCLLQIQRCIEVGLSCVETDQKRRPSARQILQQMLCEEIPYGVDDQARSRSGEMGAVAVVEATCEVIFGLVMSMDETRYEWDCSFSYGSLIEEVDGHTTILYHRLRLDWCSMLIWPRDLCYVRYWRRNDDGSYVVLFRSTEHQNCGPQPGFVRAFIESGSFKISPLKSLNGGPRTKVQHLMHIDLKGWGVNSFPSFKYHSLLQMLNCVEGLRKYCSQTDEIHEFPRIRMMH